MNTLALTGTALYTIGYSGWTPEQVRDEVRRLDAVLVDVRLVARSRRPGFNLRDLHALLGDRYLHVPAFGNLNYRTGGPIMLKDPGTGAEQIGPLLGRRNVIFLCACRDVETCHRRRVADLVARVTGLPVEHLAPPLPDDQVLLPAISIQQPWAWLVVNAPSHRDLIGTIIGKVVENRDYPTKHRGPLLIHASSNRSRKRHDEVAAFVRQRFGSLIQIPEPTDMTYGGIVGEVDQYDCVHLSGLHEGHVGRHGLMWAFGPWCHLYRAARPLPFIRCHGRTKIFYVPQRLLATTLEATEAA